MSTLILNQLGSLDLSKKESEQKAKELIYKLGKFGFITKTLHPGDSIIRARPNYDGEQFFSKDDYSFKPQNKNFNYGRASTPNQTMFYGCLQNSISEEERRKGLTGRYITALETFEWLRSRTTSCYQVVSYGNWIVKEPINVGVIAEKKNYFVKREFTSELVELFQKFSLHHPESKDYTLEVLDFFARQFKRYDANSRNCHRYILSALFSEIVVKAGLDGIMYPSVRIGGKGFNVALKPDAVKKMELRVVGECHIYKKKSKAFINNVTMTELLNNESTFSLLKIADPNLSVNEDRCLKMINASSISDLKNCKDWDPEANKLTSLYERFLQWIYRY